jgi:hypothetical protein
MKIKDRLKYFKKMTPDDAMYVYGKQVTAFVYNSTTNTLFCQNGGKMHSVGIGGKGYSKSDETDLAQTRKEPKGSRIIIGRFGVDGREDAGGFISIWPYDEYSDDSALASSYLKEINATQGGKVDVTKMLNAMLNNSCKIVGQPHSPYPITSDYIYGDLIDPVTTVEKFMNLHAPKNDCRAKAQINVQGRAIPFSTLLGDFHMVKGQQLDIQIGSICSQKNALKNAVKDCDHESNTLDQLVKLANCKDDKQDYQQAKQRGAAAYKSDLRSIFNNPNKIDSEFRTQKQIDQAWDDLHKEATFTGFKEWMGQ